jgi:hypothetical protein
MSIEEEIKSIQKGDYRAGWAWWNRIKTNGIKSFADKIAAENVLADAKIALEKKNRDAVAARLSTARAKEDFELEIKLQIEIFNLRISREKTERELTEKAVQQGFQLSTHQELLLFERQEAVKVSTHIQISRNDAQIRKIEKTEDHILDLIAYQTKADIEIHKDYQIRMNQLKGITAYKLIGNDKLEQARKFVLNLIQERDEVKNSNLLPESKQEYLDLLEISIRRATEAYSNGEHRLYETGNGQNVGGFDEDSDL